MQTTPTTLKTPKTPKTIKTTQASTLRLQNSLPSLPVNLITALLLV
jgi:hypothetical protein